MGFTAPFAGGLLNVAASNYAKQYRNNMLVGDMLAPRCPMDRQTFQYVVHDKSAMRLDGDDLRAPGNSPRSIRSSFSTSPYFCRSHSLMAEIPYELEQYGEGFGFSEIAKATGQTMDKILLGREVNLAALLLNPSNTPNTLALSGTSMWDNAASDPIAAVEAAKAVVRQSGVQANILALSDPAFVALQTNPAIIERFKYTEPGSITLDDLTSVFRIKCVMASAVVLDKNDNETWVWGESAVLMYQQDVSDQNDLSAVKTFTWKNAKDTVDGYGVIVEPKYPLSAKATLVSADWYYDLRITAPETLFTFTSVCAAPTMVANAAPAEGY